MADIHSEPTAPPPVRDRRTAPPGILSRNTQNLVLAGIAAVMVAVIALSGSNAPKVKPTASAAQPATVIDPNAARIQEYEKSIEDQTRKVQAEQAQLMRAQGQGSANAPAPIGHSVPAYSRTGESPYLAVEDAGDNAIRTDQKKRDYQSLFASNLAFTYRKELVAGDPGTNVAVLPKPTSASALSNTLQGDPSAVMQPMTTAFSAPAATTAITLQSPQAGGSKTTGTDARSPAATQQDAKGRERDAALDRAGGRRYRLFEGTVLETVLTNRLDGSFSGPVNCMITTNVYSHNGLHLLVPQGSRVLGEVRRVENFGEQRVAVTFHRLIMPDGYSVSLDQFHGLSQIGETGLQDQVNHHYVQVFGVSLAIGAIAGLSQANTSYGVDQSALDAYRQGAAASLSQSSLRILDRYLNVLPTITIREGHRVKIYLSDDLMLPAYDQHQMPGEL